MAKVRFYYDIYVDEDDLKENLELNSDADLTEEDIVDRAKTIFAYDIQDRDIHVDELEYEVME